MENENVDMKKVIEEMEVLKAKAMEDIAAEMKQTGDISGEELGKKVTVKYLGKIGLSNEQGEIVEKDWYAVIETHGNQIVINYYAENQIYLGQQLGKTQ